MQGVRLILSVCLLVSSVAGFFALLQYAKLNVALSLTIVVGVNVCLAGVLLLIIILKGPAQVRLRHGPCLLSRSLSPPGMTILVLAAVRLERPFL